MVVIPKPKRPNGAEFANCFSNFFIDFKMLVVYQKYKKNTTEDIISKKKQLIMREIGEIVRLVNPIQMYCVKVQYLDLFPTDDCIDPGR